jgi:phage gp36-like protein
MAYTTEQALIDRVGESVLIQVTDRATPATGEVDSALVARTIAKVDASIDAVLRGRWPLPLTEPQPDLEPIATSLVLGQLMTLNRPSDIQRDYEEAQKLLGEYARGLRSPVLSETEAAEPENFPGIGVAGDDPVWTEERLARMGMDDPPTDGTGTSWP